MAYKINTIWEDYHNSLFLFIQKRVPEKATAEDILQDVFVKIVKNIDTLSDSTKIRSWIYQITRNTIIDHYRSSKRYQELSLISDVPIESDGDISENEISCSILPIINDLPDKYKSALLLSEIKGLPQKEIARKLNISYSNTKIRVQRGRKMLKKLLTDCCSFKVDVYGKALEYQKNGDICSAYEESKVCR